MTIKNFKVTSNDFLGAIWDVLMMCVRPFLCMIIWNFGVAIDGVIPHFNFLQVIALIVIYHIWLTYIPFHIIANSASANKDENDES